ncbi:MAG: tRNA lysidine(34) synthetase TilS [Bacteroidales bacterium]|nr:tRNA lysidine(34) synthetase TilS [Bacteroidales bacterium]
MSHKTLNKNQISKYFHDNRIRKLIVGVSGGADSMALLHCLQAAGLDILAVHCNFHLRGDESNRDMEFVKEYCKSERIALQVIEFDVDEFRRLNGGSVEMACRDLRYNKFRELMQQTGSDRIAVAHNADDQAETLLLNLMRGAGVSGLRAMKHDTGFVVRPLLDYSRSEIERYLIANNIPHIEDSTNGCSDYQRNFLRNEILPALSARWPDVKRSLCKTASIMEQEEGMLHWAEEKLSPTAANILTLSNLNDSPDPLWLLRRFITRHGFSENIMAEVMRSIEGTRFMSGKQWFSQNKILTLERDRLEVIDTDEKIEICTVVTEFEMNVPLLTTIFEAPLSELWTPLPPSKIKFRFAEKGDRIKPLGMNGSMAVSKVFKDAKLSYQQKRLTIVACEIDTNEVVWIAGLRRSRTHLADKETQRIYKYTVSTSSRK